MSSMTPTAIDLGKGGFEGLAITANDYTLATGETIDYQTLTLHIAKTRAHALEKEITPLAKKMEARNDELALLGYTLATLTEASEQFDSDAEGSDTTSFTLDEKAYCYLLDHHLMTGVDFSYDVKTSVATATKSVISGVSEAIKTRIDRLNTSAQMDMTRLESLVARRDEAFEAASDFLKSVSGSRDTVLQEMG
ncbi:MAG: hypothetical protein IJV69_05480 [Kiritimatiellae bacterium]|nr:hypothetical protein [Kiritimatiellia bacterium]